MNIRDGMPNLSLLNLNTSAGGINRQTVNTNFAGKLRYAARDTTLTAQKAASYVAPFVPGAALVSAGLGNVANNLGPDVHAGRAQMGGPSAAVSAVGQSGDFLTAMEDMQQNMTSTNMHMLGVQQKVQQESQIYLTASNLMKAKHDTDKNSINNIR